MEKEGKGEREGEREKESLSLNLTSSMHKLLVIQSSIKLMSNSLSLRIRVLRRLVEIVTYNLCRSVPQQLPPLSLSSYSLSNTAQSICEAFALYIRQIPLLFWPFSHFFILQVQVASRRVASPCLFALRWAFAVSMNMNYGNCRAATTAQQQQSVAHNKNNRNGRNTVAITATFFSRISSVLFALRSLVH